MGDALQDRRLNIFLEAKSIILKHTISMKQPTVIKTLT